MRSGFLIRNVEQKKNVRSSRFGRKKKRKKEKKREVFRVLKYCVQGFEICNVEGSLKGKKKKG